MTRLYLYAALLLLTQCSKCKNDPEPKDELPPATQTGANTFGCLVNGRVFTPQGGSSLSRNLSVEYDPNFNGGTFSLSAYRVNGGTRESMAFALIPVTGPGTYLFTQAGGNTTL